MSPERIRKHIVLSSLGCTVALATAFLAACQMPQLPTEAEVRAEERSAAASTDADAATGTSDVRFVTEYRQLNAPFVVIRDTREGCYYFQSNSARSMGVVTPLNNSSGQHDCSGPKSASR